MNAPSLANLSAQQLRRAAELKDRIEALQAELNRLVGAPAGVAAASNGARRKLSAAAIARIRAAQRARWARIRGKGGSAARKPKRRVSAAGRARLSALAKARWAKVKAQGRSKL